MAHSQRKGKTGELEVCALFRKAYGTGFNRKGLGKTGSDIICPDWFPYAIEVKNYASIKHRHLFSPNQILIAFLRQADKQAKAEGKKALTVLKIESQWYAISEFDYKTQRDYLTIDKIWMVRRLDDWLELHRGIKPNGTT